MNTANLHVLSNVAEAPQALLEPVSQVRTCLIYVINTNHYMYAKRLKQ